MNNNGNGVLGLTRPRNGNRDQTGTFAFQMNSARERLVKRGADVSRLSLADLQAEVDRWEAEQAGVRQAVAADRQAAEGRHTEFMKAYRRAEPGDVIGPDREGHWFQLNDDEELVRVTAP